jgi:hypothetical protein
MTAIDPAINGRVSWKCPSVYERLSALHAG